jgi:hypothetical protein
MKTISKANSPEINPFKRGHLRKMALVKVIQEEVRAMRDEIRIAIRDAIKDEVMAAIKDSVRDAIREAFIEEEKEVKGEEKKEVKGEEKKEVKGDEKIDDLLIKEEKIIDDMKQDEREDEPDEKYVCLSEMPGWEKLQTAIDELTAITADLHQLHPLRSIFDVGAFSPLKEVDYKPVFDEEEPAFTHCFYELIPQSDIIVSPSCQGRHSIHRDLPYPSPIRMGNYGLYSTFRDKYFWTCKA